MSRAPRTVLALVDLVQDLDVLLPILVGIRDTPSLRLKIRVSGWLARRAPRIPSLLTAHGLAFRYVPRPALLKGWGPPLDSVDVLLTAADSTAGPHRWTHAAVSRANSVGIATCTVQHGLDNIAVLVGEPPNARRFASRVMFCWPPAEALSEHLDPETRARLVSVGRSAPALDERAPVFDVGVFENLHTVERTEAERRQFLDGLLGLGHARPDLRLYVRSHPAGGWLDGSAPALALLPNVTFAPSKAARRSPEHPAEGVRRARRIITTPSTIALDAAQAGRPVALTLDGGALYAGLPRLDTPQDWIAFAAADTPPSPAQGEFLRRHLIPGDPIPRILERLTTL